MRLPWLTKRVQERAAVATEASEAMLAALTVGQASIGATAALETAAGLMARSFAVATVTPDGPRTASLTPSMLADVGRSLVETGNYVALIDYDRLAGRVVLERAYAFKVTGSGQRRYRLKLARPSGKVTRSVPADAVVHVRINAAADSPWIGRGALEVAASTSGLLSEVEARLAGEAAGSSGYLIPAPTLGEGDEGDGGEPTNNATAALAGDIKGARGRTVLVPTMAGGWGDGTAETRGMAGDYSVRRYGINPPQWLIELRSRAERSVLAAAGVPPDLIEGTDAASSRESMRRYLHGTLAPHGELVADELGAALGVVGLSLNFDRLYAADIQGRARAYRSLTGTEGNLPSDVAARLAGLDVDADRTLTGGRPPGPDAS